MQFLLFASVFALPAAEIPVPAGTAAFRPVVNEGVHFLQPVNAEGVANGPLIANSAAAKAPSTGMSAGGVVGTAIGSALVGAGLTIGGVALGAATNDKGRDDGADDVANGVLIGSQVTKQAQRPQVPLFPNQPFPNQFNQQIPNQWVGAPF